MPKTQIIRDHHLWTRDTIKNVSGNVTLDIAGNIICDPSSGITQFFKAGNTTNYAHIKVGTDGETTLRSHQSGEVTGSADITIDAQGDIELNADGGDITFKDDTTTLAEINSSGDFLVIGNLTERGLTHTHGVAGNTNAVTYTAIATTGDIAGKNLTVSAGSTTTGSNNLNGGDLVIASGAG